MKILSVYGSAASGSTASHTASRNKGGQFLRLRSKPTNPRTAGQIGVRNAMAQLSAAWKGLTSSQRAQWLLLAQANPVPDKLGATITLSGFNCFFAFNAPIFQGFGPSGVVLVPPFIGPYLPAPSFGASGNTLAASGTFHANITCSQNIATGDLLILYISKPISGGKTNNNAAQRLAGAYSLTVSMTPTPIQTETGTSPWLIGGSIGSQWLFRVVLYQAGMKCSEATLSGIGT